MKELFYGVREPSSRFYDVLLGAEWKDTKSVRRKYKKIMSFCTED